MSHRTVPMRTTFEKMRQVAHETARALSKQVDLHLAGEETELDPTVLECLVDPLLHLVRNAVDHGIESAEKRASAGKPAMGNVSLSARREGGHLSIEVKDDGAGIDIEGLKRKAFEQGLVPSPKGLSEAEALDLVFVPGLSTKDEATLVSGRGIGMDVVKNQVDRLSGKIRISTEAGRGTTVVISIPSTS